MTPEQKQNVELARNVDAYSDYSDLCRHIKLLVSVIDEQESTINGLYDKFEEAIYKHIDAIEAEYKKLEYDTFRAVGHSVRVSGIRDTLNILAQLK